MTRPRYGSLCLVLLGIASALVCSAQRFTFKSFAQAEGLSNTATTCLFQDHSGFIWVGTQNGLFRYEGRTFRPYGQTDGLPSSFISTIAESPDGTLWVGSQPGLARQVGRGFQTVALGPNPSVVTDIRFDRYGKVYIGTWDGLFRATLRNGTFHIEQLVKGHLGGLAIDGDGNGWFGYNRDLYRLTNGTYKPAGTLLSLPADNWSTLTYDHHGNLWARNPTRLYELPHGAERFLRMDSGLPTTAETALSVTQNDELLVPTDSGLAVRRGAKWDMVGVAQGLTGDVVTCAIRDREGALWIASSGSGVSRLLGAEQWESWTKAEGLLRPSVWAIERSRRGELWVGTNLGLQVRQTSGNGWRHWTRQDGLAADRITALAADRDGSIWAGGFPGALVHFDPNHKIVAVCDRSCGLTSDKVTALLQDPTGRLWVSTVTGLFRSENPTGGPHAPKFFRTEPSEAAGIRFGKAVLARNGSLLFPSDKGVFIFANGHWSNIGIHDGLRFPEIGSVAQDRQGAIWVTYVQSGGAERLERQENRWAATHFDHQNGLGTDQVYSVGIDKAGALWFLTDSGVLREQNGIWRHFGEADGLIWADCDQNAFLSDNDGTVWIGTSGGLSHFTDAAPAQLPPPSVTFTYLSAGGKERSPGSSPVLAHDENSMLVGFSALAFSDEAAIQYEYRLSGLEKHWMPTVAQEARYSSLPPGSYSFEVRARNANSVWGPPARLTLHVQPPWWETTWFYGACACVLALLLRLVWRSRVSRLLEQQAALERAVTARTHELAERTGQLEVAKLHAEEASRLKSHFLANMSHEIRTPLNGVIGMLQLLAGTHRSAEQTEYLDDARSSAEGLLHLLNDVLDLSKIEADHLELERIPFSLEKCLSEAVRTLTARARQKGLHLSSSVAPDVPPVLAGDPVRFKQIILNLVGNAIKFTEHGDISVLVKREQHPDSGAVLLHVEVKDTGVGIAREDCQHIFEAFRQADASTTRRYGGTGLGLAICLRLVEKMNGEIWVESELGCGSVFHFTALLSAADPKDAPQLPETLQSADAPAGAARALRILLAEDNLLNQKIAVRLLQRHGHSVTVASDGLQAVAIGTSQRFDIIFMDLQMPGLDGLEAAQRLRQHQSLTGTPVPIVAMTASAMTGDRERCLASGMDGYIAKPIDAKELIALAHSLAAVHELV